MGGGGLVGGCQGGWERRIEAFVTIQKKMGGWEGSGRGRVGGVGSGGQGGCEQRSKVFVKIQKKNEGGVGVGGVGGSDQGLGWVRWCSKVRGRWVMWGMRDVNQE